MNYKQLIQPRKGTVDGAGWCLRFAQSFFGAPVKYGSAWEAWTNVTHKHGVNEPLPAGAAVLVWFSHYGTYSGVTKNWGHVAIHVPGDGIYTSPWYKAHGQEKYGSVSDIERIFSAKYVGWSEAINGLRVAEPAKLAPNQRQVAGLPVIRRAEPSSKSKDLGEPLKAGVVGNFNGWKRGEKVNGVDVWFRGAIDGGWFWAGAFTSQSTSGLTDLNPAPKPEPKPTPKPDPKPAVNQRQVFPAPYEANVRKTAVSNAALVKVLKSSEIITPEGWVKGQSVSGNDLWYKVAGGYAWSGGFTSQSTANLKDLNPVTPPEPKPVPQPEPATEYEPFEAFSPVVTRVDPAHVNNYEVGRFPDKQTEVVLHDFGVDGVDSFAGTVAWFKNPNADASAHFVVSGQNIIQMVSLKNRAYHSGPEGNNRVGIEFDPAVGRKPGDPLRDQTIESGRKLLKALDDHYKTGLTLRKHPEFMSTRCGDDINLAEFDIYFVEPDTPDPETPDAPGSLENRLQEATEALKQLTRTLHRIYRLEER